VLHAEFYNTQEDITVLSPHWKRSCGNYGRSSPSNTEKELLPFLPKQSMGLRKADCPEAIDAIFQLRADRAKIR